jgi:hypothetical protein
LHQRTRNGNAELLTMTHASAQNGRRDWLVKDSSTILACDSAVLSGRPAAKAVQRQTAVSAV